MTSAIVVLGMHRSGTSCLAGMLAAGGAHPPGRTVRNWDNARGHFEAADVVRLNEAVLAHAGGHWLQPPTAVRWDVAQGAERDRLLGLPGALLKDPRTLLTLPFWRERPCRFIGIVRHPLAVARSLLAWRRMPLAEGLALWTAHNRILLAAQRDLEFPLLDFAQEPAAFIAAVAAAAARLELVADHALLAAAYAAELVHHDAEDGPDAPDGEALALHAELAARCVGAGTGATATRTPFPWAHLDRQQRCLRDGDPAQALIAARAALTAGIDPGAVLVPAVKSFLDHGRCDEALALLAEAGARPGLPPALADLLAAKALLRGGRPAEAVDRLVRACAVADPDHEARLLLPQALRAAGRKAEAATAQEAVVADALYPHGPLATAATWAEQDGDRPRAVALLRRAIAAAPPRRRGRLRTRLAELLAAQGLRGDACAELRQSLADDPAWTRAADLLARMAADA